eukprot:gb/GECH01004913.1/.p1 GENE.gb/GECH01004913.1/~~gb/GECH01004913.1/.p1  ORF type:complete len:429 (+),score=90.73 gb/GECH01004913.1/:1-1287(+)
MIFIFFVCLFNNAWNALQSLQQEEETSPIIEACKRDRTEKVLELLRTYSTTELNTSDNSGFTLLHWCCYRENTTIIAEILKRHDVNVEIRNKEGKTPADVTVSHGIHMMLNDYKQKFLLHYLKEMKRDHLIQPHLTMGIPSSSQQHVGGQETDADHGEKNGVSFRINAIAERVLYQQGINPDGMRHMKWNHIQYLDQASCLIEELINGLSTREALSTHSLLSTMNENETSYVLMDVFLVSSICGWRDICIEVFEYLQFHLTPSNILYGLHAYLVFMFQQKQSLASLKSNNIKLAETLLLNVIHKNHKSYREVTSNIPHVFENVQNLVMEVSKFVSKSKPRQSVLSMLERMGWPQHDIHQHSIAIGNMNRLCQHHVDAGTFILEEGTDELLNGCDMILVAGTGNNDRNSDGDFNDNTVSNQSMMEKNDL